MVLSSEGIGRISTGPGSYGGDHYKGTRLLHEGEGKTLGVGGSRSGGGG